jgi:nifR3 family TIM-barrel protein
MDGLSDQPTRALAREFGSAISYTEFLNTIDILNDNRDIHERMSFLETERPVAFQLLDDSPERMLEAAKRIIHLGPDFLDINLGCPSRAITSRGAGAALLQKPASVARAIQLLTREFTIPVTAKIRLGWDDRSLNYLDIAHIIEDNGGAMVAVHGRTRAQGYQGTARWEPIAEIKKNIKIPVLANGDIRTADDIKTVLDLTDCDGVMVGRASLGNPWIFARQNLEDISLTDTLKTIQNHVLKMIDFYGENAGVIFFRKHLKAYLKRFGIPRGEMVALLTTPDYATLMKLINQIPNVAKRAKK